MLGCHRYGLRIFAIGLFCLISQPLVAQFDSTHIPNSAIGAVVVHPQHIASLESLQLLPWEVATAAGLQQMGIDPLQIKQLVFLLDKPDFQSDPEFGCIIRFANPTAMGGEMFKFAEPQPYQGGRIYRVGPGVSLMEVNPKTFLFGTQAMLDKMITSRGTQSPLTNLMGSNANPESLEIFMTMESIRPQIMQMLSEIDDIPAEFEKFRNLPNMVDSWHLQQNLSNHQSSLTLNATDGNSQELAETLMNGLQVGKNLILNQLSNAMDQSDQVQKATLSWANRIGDHLENQLQPTVNGNQVVFDASYGVASAPVMVALLLPAVQQARAAARRVDSANRLRMLILSMHNYHDSYKRLPTNLYPRESDENTKPLLSWRVQILPYIEQNALYEQFHLDEPWDSEHNIKLIELMPQDFVCPNVNLEPGKTIYQAASGRHTMFDGNGRRTLERIMDGTSRTIALVEADEDRAVIWTKPDDFKVDWENPINGLGGIRPEGFNAAFFDGSVRLISGSVDLRTLRLLFDSSDGEVPLNF